MLKGGVDSVHRPPRVRHRGGIRLPRSDLLRIYIFLGSHAEPDYQQDDSGYCQGRCDSDGEGRGTR
jgi:hypothetical protein